MLNREAWRNIGVLFTSVVAALAIAEIVVRLFVPVLHVGPSFTVYDPVLGRRLRAGVNTEQITPDGFKVRISTNSLGFRGKEPDTFPRGGILFLGDSFTMGFGVSDGEEFPARIAEEFRRMHGNAAMPVVNAGFAGSGNGYWVRFLRSKAEALQPRLVVMQIFDNDFDDNVREKYFALEPNGSLQELPIARPRVTRRLQSVVEAIPGLSHSHLIGLLRQARVSAFQPPQDYAEKRARVQALEPSDQLTLRIVEEAIAVCQMRGWSVLGLLAGLPDAHEAAVKTLFARRGVPVLVIPAKSERADLYFKTDFHWNASGHAFVAGRMLETLNALGIKHR